MFFLVKFRFFIIVNNSTVTDNKNFGKFEKEKTTIVTSQTDNFLMTPVGMATIAIAFFVIIIIIIAGVSCWLKKRRNSKTRDRSGKLFVPY